MVKIIMHGYQGRMGRVICDLVDQDENCAIVAGIDAKPPRISEPFPVYTEIIECDMPADVIIDFSYYAAIPQLLDYAVQKNTPVVLCTTGLDDALNNQILLASEKVAIFKSANMSLGINLIANMLKKVTKVLYQEGFDMEIIERHHHQKLDAPSGTALLLADVMNESVDHSLKYVYDRSKEMAKRERNELGLHAVRGGTIVGDHEVLFAGKDEIIEFKHSAYSKEVFAVGALKAAKFIATKRTGLYDMNDLMAEIL